jgi:hypothetical protein
MVINVNILVMKDKYHYLIIGVLIIFLIFIVFLARKGNKLAAAERERQILECDSSRIKGYNQGMIDGYKEGFCDGLYLYSEPDTTNK